MAKFNKLKQAQKLYVQENKTLGEIGMELDLSRRTLFYWKKKYDWDKRKFEYEHEKDAFSQELLELARKMMRKLNNDLDKNSHTNQSEIYSFMNILKTSLCSKNTKLLLLHPNQNNKTSSPPNKSAKSNEKSWGWSKQNYFAK